jgi:hypothetical protein
MRDGTHTDTHSPTVIFRTPSPDERRHLDDMPERVPIAEVRPPGKGRHRRLVRGDRYQFVFAEPGGGE